MKRWISAAAVAAFAVIAVTMALTAGASAGNGTGITATPPATKTFNGSYSATFSRSASGLITETNRVNSNGAQNSWSPYDVWLQFRPQTNPSGGVVPNPACDSSGLVTPQFPYTNDQPSLNGTATSGYFLSGVKYNVCVYLAHPFALTLTGNGSATSAPITTAETVVYAGKYTNGAAPVPGATVGLTVFHGYDCVIGQGFYTDASYTTTDASGNYSKESGTPPGAGLYSARTNVGSNDHSNCVNIPVTEVPAVAESANGNVNFSVELGLASGPLTGNVTFDAQGTTTNATGQLAMTNSLGYALTGAVTCFNRIDAQTAVFSGKITTATLYANPGYFIAKVIDNGSAGDKIVVFVNEHGNADCSDPSDGSPGSDILADVTTGNLVVH